MPSREIAQSRDRQLAGAVYLHVPFCASKCKYCDFYSVPLDTDLAAAYVRAAQAELQWHSRFLQRPAQSVFFGGGTPTVLSPALMEPLLTAFAPFVGPRTEFTVEANPGTLDAEMAELLASHGVNRASIGAQSFHAGELAVLGRMHAPADVARAVAQARREGITNISLDLIYGIPGQTRLRWADSLRQALDLQVDHLSIYALAFEPATPLWEDLQAGRTAEVAEDLQRAFYYDALEAASAANLEHYEVSNLARPGMRCRHNLTYWHNVQYVGLGPGATSYIDGVRRKTRPDLSAYLQAAATGCPPPAEAERLTAPRVMAEALMLGLRLVGGVNRRAFADRYGRDPVQAFAHSVDKHLRMGSIIVTPDVIKIARDSFFVSDAVLADIVAEGQLFSGRPPDVLNTPPHRTDKRT